MSPARLILRAAREADVPPLIELEQRAFPSSWPATDFERELRSNALARYVVVEDLGDHRIVAFGGLWTVVDEAHIVTVAVDPLRRGAGLGGLVVHGLLELAIDLNLSTATLEVRPSNSAGRALYRRFGFHEVGRRKEYYEDREDALILTTEDFSSPGFRRAFTQAAASLGGLLTGQDSG